MFKRFALISFCLVLAASFAHAEWLSGSANGSGGGGGGGAGIDRVWLTQSNATVAGSALSLPLSNAPTPNASAGSNVQTGYLTFPASSKTSGYGVFPVTASVPTSLTMEIMWRTTDTNIGHTVTWNWNYACTATSIDPALSSAGTVTANAVSSSNQTTLSTITLSSPTASANQNCYFQIARRGDTDSITAGVDVASVRIHN